MYVSTYCYKPLWNTVGDLFISQIPKIVTLMLATMLFEIPVFFIFFKKRKDALLYFFISNLISYPIFYMFSLIYAVSQPILYIPLEFLVIIFETGILKLKLKKIALSKVFIYSFVANLVSVILGIGIFIRLLY